MVDADSVEDALYVAKAAMDGERIDYIGDSVVYYHSNKVKPKWSKKMKLVAVIGKHKFYSEKT